MRVVACAKELKKAMRVAMAVCPSRTPMEILRFVKIVCDEEMHIISTDNAQSIKVLVPGAQVEKKGEALVHAKQGHQIVQRSEEFVVIESTSGGTKIISGQDKFEMLTEETSLFPTVKIDPIDPGYCHEMSADALDKSIKRTVFAADRLNAKYALGGTSLDLTEDGPCFLVGTDGRRITAQRLQAEGFGGHHCDPKMTIAPTDGMKALSDSIRFTEAVRVRICCGASALLAESETFSLSCQWLEGRFPSPWQRMMVSKDSIKHADAACSAGELLEAIRKSEIMADDTEIAVQFSFRDGEVVLSRHGFCVGQSEVVVECDVLGPPAEVKMNPSYMKEWLNAVDFDDTVSIRYPLEGATNMQMSVPDGGYYTQSVIVEAATASV